MKQIDAIEVRILDEENRIEQKTFGYGGRQNHVDEFFQFLIDEGFYDDIQATKHFSTSKTVMKRLKGQ